MTADEDLLVYSLNEFAPIIRECLEIARPKRVLEVGGEAGHFTRTLATWAEEFDFEVIVAEPSPSPGLRAIEAGCSRVYLLEQKSPAALSAAEPCDIYFLDGDHNYSTLSGELQWLGEFGRSRPFLAFLHDVGWPCAYRDLYYDPASLPPEGTHDYSFEMGVSPHSRGVVPWGFRGEGEWATAREEGGLSNGVLSAVEAFLNDFVGYRFFKIPCIFGLGILVSEDGPWSDDISSVLRPYHENSLLSRLERNRLDLYLKVLELNDGLSATKRELETCRFENEDVVEQLRAELLSAREALALSATPPVHSQDAETVSDEEKLRSISAEARRSLGYDIYRAQIKARRIGDRLKDHSRR